ncbi:hypothetical protein F2981_32820 (plasmid) [Sinorhizobium meliloti]|nr:hypothetical protein [Sinorhizobium meliloti]
MLASTHPWPRSEGPRTHWCRPIKARALRQCDPGQRRFYVRTCVRYGDHDQDNPTPAESRAWTLRPDPFSTYRAGFEIRTRRFLPARAAVSSLPR